VVTQGSGKASQSTSYAYDAFGQRLLRQAPQGLRFYQYDLAGHLLEEGGLANGSAAPERDYIYLGDRPVALLLPSTGALFFLHGDRLDTPQFATDGAKRAEWKAAYQPFGVIRPVILNLAQNLRLPGQYADQETGYYHNGFRTYAADLGRYLESDPIGLRGGLNTYIYVRANPLRGTDRFGLQEDDFNIDNAIKTIVGTADAARKVAVAVLCSKITRPFTKGDLSKDVAAGLGLGSQVNNAMDNFIKNYQDPGSMAFPGEIRTIRH
jgi:RHS repeat-associated protein